MHLTKISFLDLHLFYLLVLTLGLYVFDDQHEKETICVVIWSQSRAKEMNTMTIANDESLYTNVADINIQASYNRFTIAPQFVMKCDTPILLQTDIVVQISNDKSICDINNTDYSESWPNLFKELLSSIDCNRIISLKR